MGVRAACVFFGFGVVGERFASLILRLTPPSCSGAASLGLPTFVIVRRLCYGIIDSSALESQVVMH